MASMSSFARPPCRLRIRLEASQVGDGLKRLVGRLDRLAVELEGALRLDQRDELLHRINVASLEEPLQSRARAVFAGDRFDRLPRSGGFDVDVAAEELEALRVDELGDAELPG